jgi:DNA-binding MarR family transcriptional regulator
VGEHVEGVPPAAALLRRPALRVRHEIIRELREAGFRDILPAHLGVFQHPGPEGRRPSELALRNTASKQSMNHLLHQLEAGGYIVREPSPLDRRSRVVRLTPRGWEAVELIRQVVERIESEWAEQIGEQTYAQLCRALAKLDAVLDPVLDTGGANGSEVPSRRHVR